MPITKQVIKRVKQAERARQRNRHYSSNMKSMVKLILDYIKKDEKEKAIKILPKVVSSIDTCAKKNIIKKNTAARKKSRIQKAINGVSATESKKTKEAEEPKEKEVKEKKE